MKTTFLSIAFALCMFVNTKAQAFLGVGTGTDSFESWIVNIQAGYRFKYFVPEFELKIPPTCRLIKEPAVMSAKLGYPINLGGRWMLLPQMVYSYMYHSADQSKGDTWENGFKAGIGCRQITWAKHT